jgi:PAS domain S-box-containing protein
VTKSDCDRRASEEGLIAGLNDLPVPLCTVDRDGKFSSINRSATALLGEVLGSHYSRVVAPEDFSLARRQFARKMIGQTRATEYELTLLDRDGHRTRAHIRSVALRDGHATVGILGVMIPDLSESTSRAQALRPSSEPKLTPRQFETLRLLGDGLSTTEIATQLGVSDDTARNHVRAVMRAFGAHSRLEAVVSAQRLGLLTPNA